MERGVEIVVMSMTGFGRSHKLLDGLDVTVEIKSVNGRQFDCGVKISRAFAYLEEKVKPFLQDRGVSRGKIEVRITAERPGGSGTKVRIDRDYLESYLDALDALHEDYHLKDDRSVMKLASLPGILIADTPAEDEDADWRRISSVLEEAASAFLASRAVEGEALAKDLLEKIDKVDMLVKQIEALSDEDVKHYRERLAKRVREALADNAITIDESRILTECAIHADKIAIDEEMVRLRTHIASFREDLKKDEPMGKKLGFTVVEMGREINTSASKCQNATIAGLVIEVKNELEKIREQVQNLE